MFWIQENTLGIMPDKKTGYMTLSHTSQVKKTFLNFPKRLNNKNHLFWTAKGENMKLKLSIFIYLFILFSLVSCNISHKLSNEMAVFKETKEGIIGKKLTKAEVSKYLRHLLYKNMRVEPKNGIPYTIYTFCFVYGAHCKDILLQEFRTTSSDDIRKRILHCLRYIPDEKSGLQVRKLMKKDPNILKENKKSLEYFTRGAPIDIVDVILLNLYTYARDKKTESILHNMVLSENKCKSRSTSQEALQALILRKSKKAKKLLEKIRDSGSKESHWARKQLSLLTGTKLNLRRTYDLLKGDKLGIFLALLKSGFLQIPQPIFRSKQRIAFFEIDFGEEKIGYSYADGVWYEFERGVSISLDGIFFSRDRNNALVFAHDYLVPSSLWGVIYQWEFILEKRNGEWHLVQVIEMRLP